MYGVVFLTETSCVRLLNNNCCVMYYCVVVVVVRVEPEFFCENKNIIKF